MEFEHVPVLLDKVIETIAQTQPKTILDATLGLGGYSARFLSEFPQSTVIGIDQDSSAREIAKKRLENYGNRLITLDGNFRELYNIVIRSGITSVDCIVFDLGVSNMQLVDGRRGFSFRENGPLDMRMNTESNSLNARDIINKFSAQELSAIFKEYGEERFAWQIAKQIVRSREKEPIETTQQLVDVIRQALPAPVMRKMGGHPARKVFQALRIHINDELSALKDALDDAKRLTNKNGLILAVTYHSLEDRIVKHTFRGWKDAQLGILFPRKAIEPTDEEVELNHKSRSARLRGFLMGA